jgi:hypothetical protein
MFPQLLAPRQWRRHELTPAAADSTPQISTPTHRQLGDVESRPLFMVPQFQTQIQIYTQRGMIPYLLRLY